MPTFFARRYMRKLEEVGGTEKVIGVIVLFLLACVVVTFATQVAANKDYLFNVDEAVYGVADHTGEFAVAAQMLPALDDPQWQAPSKVFRFTPETLYQKINGRADAYLQFHVAGLTFGTYHHQTDTDRSVDVYWYDMGEPQNAFGMYRSEAPQDVAKVAVGREGYRAGGAVFLWKGSSYIQVLPMSLDDGDARVALSIAERLAERIEDDSDTGWAQLAFPQAGRLDDSLEYIAQNAFGLGFLDDVYTAEYDFDGERVTLFVHQAVDESSARTLLDQYVGFFEKYGRVIGERPHASRRIVAGDVGGMIDVVFAKDGYLGGVAGSQNVELALKVARAFRDDLAMP